MNRKILTFIGCLSLAAMAASPVQASYLSGYEYGDAANKKVVVTKSMPVYRIKTGSCEAKNRFYAAGKVKKGTVLYRSQWFMATGCGWVIKNSQYKPGKRRFYFVQAPEKTKWFKAYKATKKTTKKKVVKKSAKTAVQKSRKKAVKKTANKPASKKNAAKP